MTQIRLLRAIAWTSIGIWTLNVVLAQDLQAAATAAAVLAPAAIAGVVPLVAVALKRTIDVRSIALAFAFVLGLVLVAPTSYVWFSPVAMLLGASALRLRRVAMPYRAS